MIEYLMLFFRPRVFIHSYNKPKKEVLDRIEQILSQKLRIFSGSDMKGRFLTNDTFEINIISVADTGGVKYGSTLVGQVIESLDGSTRIKTIAKPSFALYFLFFAAIAVGLGYLYKFIETGSIKILFLSLIILIIGPALTIGIANVNIASIRERYKTNIDKELNA